MDNAAFHPSFPCGFAQAPMPVVEGGLRQVASKVPLRLPSLLPPLHALPGVRHAGIGVARVERRHELGQQARHGAPDDGRHHRVDRAHTYRAGPRRVLSPDISPRLFRLQQPPCLATGGQVRGCLEEGSGGLMLVPLAYHSAHHWRELQQGPLPALWLSAERHAKTEKA